MSVKEALERLRGDVESGVYLGPEAASLREHIRVILDLIDQLPKTADRVPVVPDTVVYIIEDGEVCEAIVESFDDWDSEDIHADDESGITCWIEGEVGIGVGRDLWDCFSTEEAALAALAAKGATA